MPNSTAKWGQRPRRQTESDRGVVPPRATKRLNVDVSIDLHARLKVSCARQGIAMSTAVTQLLEQHFPALYND